MSAIYDLRCSVNSLESSVDRMLKEHNLLMEAVKMSLNHFHFLANYVDIDSIEANIYAKKVIEEINALIKQPRAEA